MGSWHTFETNGCEVVTHVQTCSVRVASPSDPPVSDAPLSMSPALSVEDVLSRLGPLSVMRLVGGFCSTIFVSCAV